MTIDTCIIVKNEEKTIEKLINQFLVFSNEIHITDTGSTDETLNIINRYSKQYKNIFLHHFNWVFDFSQARNYSLSCYECKSDYQFWCDGDDELNNKLIESLKEFSLSDKYNEDIYFIKYKYYIDDDNKHFRTSLLKVGQGLIWKDPVHEYIEYYTNRHKTNYTLFDNGSFIIHKMNQSVNHNERNLEIFKQMENNHCYFTCRNRYYYARELIRHNDINKGIKQLYKCIDSVENNNHVDRYNACINLFILNDSKALDYFFKLFNNEIYRKDMFYYVGKKYFNDKKYELSKFYYLLCINCKEPKPVMSFKYNKLCHINSLLQLNVIEYKLGNIKNAYEYNEKVLKIDPKNEIALKNRIFYKKHLEN